MKRTKKVSSVMISDAAPELYSELRALVDLVDSGTIIYPGTLLLEDAREALAKAEREEA
jgi:hypothetical protein